MALLTWRWFAGASTLAGGLLFKAGAPLIAIAAGIVVAALVTWRYGKGSGDATHAHQHGDRRDR